MNDSDALDPPLSGSGKDALTIATQAAKEAGTILKRHFSQEIQIQSKGKRNLVTDADLLAVAEATCTDGETIHNELVPVTPVSVMAALKAADAEGRRRRNA